MINKKQKPKLIIILSILIICLVFACSFGATFAAAKLTSTYISSPTNISTYLAKQEYSVVNDTLNSPIHFGYGAHNFDVSIKYSYGYDFDIRVEYSMSWANTTNTSTENVILLYSNRDNYVVDGQYIYYAESIKAGTGTLPIFTGVDFIDPSDENYLSGALTINIVNVKVYKTQSSYNNENPLYTNSDAGNAWLKIKQRTATTLAIIYNYRYNVQNGIDYPTFDRAYKKTYQTNSSVVAEASWLGGNKYYAGLDAYIITGSAAINLNVRATSAWSNNSNDTHDPTFENNVHLNYEDSWTQTGVVSDNFPSYSYNYQIPAYSHVYVRILKNVEITTENYRVTDENTYKDVKLVNQLEINNITFSNQRISSGTIDNATSSSTAKYAAPNITVVNQTSWRNGLYKTTSLGEAQTFYTNITLINNTNADINASVSYKLKYYISNGNTRVPTNGESTSFSSEFWFVESGEVDSSYFTPPPASILIRANASAALVSQYNVSQAFNNLIHTKYSEAYYDVWLELIPTVTTTTGTSPVGLVVENAIKDGKISLSLKNNSSASVKAPSISNLSISALTVQYTKITTQPDNWMSNYWEYFMLTGGKYVRYSSASANSQSTFQTNNCYRLSYQDTTISTAAPTLLNGFTQSGSAISSTATLRPGEIVEVAQITYTGNCLALTVNASLSGTQDAQNFVDIINENTANAFVYNTSANKYLLRVSGGNLGDNFVSQSDNFSYYVGVVYEGEIIKTPNAQKIEFIQITGEEYSSALVQSWGNAATAFYNKLFSKK